MEQATQLPVLIPDPEQGLTPEQAKQRLQAGLGNQLRQNSGRSEKEILRENCLTFFNMVFVVMAVLMLLVGSSVLNLTFMGVVIVNTVIGCVQEIRAKRAVDKLTLVAQKPVTVCRGSEVFSLRPELLVRDDIILLGPGDQICADAVVRTGSVQVNEALLTGEADAISKGEGAALLSGSFVVAGRCRAQLTRVGDEAYAARLAYEAKRDPKAAKSEMMRSLQKLIQFIGFALIPVGILLFLNQMASTGSQLRQSVEATVAALVGMIPEGLYLLTSIAMAASALKLTKGRVLVQDMNCIETLARVDVLCVDKTGTITEPKMELEQVVPLTQDPPEYLEAVLTAMYGQEEPENDTAAALQALFRGEGGWQRLSYYPFRSETKWQAAVFAGEGAFVAGAPELLLRERYGLIQAQAQPWIDAGCRVLLVARYGDEPDLAGLDCELLEPLALLVLSNRLRPQAAETFSYFAQQGVAVKVISGDNPRTVAQIAAKAGIPETDKYIDVSTLENDEQVRRAATEYTVFGRVTPERKKQLVLALQGLGHTVGMTGDGVNDVLAMKAADCGIAMASGAQAASQVAKLVLLDSDFAAMPGIVGEGRRVINNIQRAATLFLVKNIFSLGLALLTLATGLQFPLESFHLSIVAALTIGIPGFFLAMEPNYARFSGHFLSGALRKAFPAGLTSVAVVLTAQAFMAAFRLPFEDGQTITTAILCCVGLLVLLRVCRPFTPMRKAVWWAMAVCVVGAFFVLPPVLGYLRITRMESRLVLLAVLVMTPTVFFALHRLFDW
ncbi:MAG: HAD-IC family P-type ATPase, partial [Oscillospiraceae bacterium]|nr:HAD-IC family P-type ATPase [Oscillospiraceae bacterium]